MNRYDSYKDSGVEWIGKIPHHWETGKLKHNSDLRISSVDKHILEEERKVIVCNYTDVYYNEFITSNLPLRKGSCSENEYTNFLLEKGDVIITKDSEVPTDIGVPSLVKDNLENVVCGYHLSIMKPHKTKLVGSYLFRQLQTKRIRSYFEINSNGITRFGLGKSSVLETLLILPSYSEQQEIVSFLDDKTQKIDSLIQQKEKKIELLKEKRTSLINHVVTKGLDSNVEMKDSGVEWIGEIPYDWDIIPLRHLGSFQNGISKGSEFFGKGYPFMNYGDVYKYDVTPIEVGGKVESDEVERERYSVTRGDVFFTRTSETKDDIGVSSTCLKTIDNCSFSGFVIRYRLHNETHLPEFSRYHFQTHWKKVLIESKMNIVTRSSLSQRVLGMVPVLVPSIKQQQQIVEYLDKQTEEIDTLIQLEQKKIDTLKEYRQSLVSEVVTGKIRVCEEDNSLSLNSPIV